MKKRGDDFLQWGLFQVPGGWSAAAWTKKGLSALVLPQKTRSGALSKLKSYLPKVHKVLLKGPAVSVPEKIQRETRKALAGKSFRLSSFDISFMTPFQQRILRATCRIPAGKFQTYGWVARAAGSPKGFRAAGQALTRNPVPIFIPCHRVIAGGGRLGGYGGGIAWKTRLLMSEGVSIKAGLVS